MDPNRWTRIEELYHAALELPPRDRAAFLASADPGLRAEVESLLGQSGEGLLDRPSDNLIAGARLGPYEILTCIGIGGMGAVYTARDTRVGRTVAIKISSTPWSGRGRREARAVAALNHPHICTLFDVGPNYLVMEHVEGKPLRGPLPVGEALRLAGQLLDALDAAHRKGIVHRDLKPANILVGASGVKVLDFGLAKIDHAVPAGTDTRTASGVILGTPLYMSPEQVQGQAVDPRSDLFSFGLVLYEMLTGRRAFDSLEAILERDPPCLERIAPPTLQRTLRRCLVKSPADRWQSAADVKAALTEKEPAWKRLLIRKASSDPHRQVIRVQVPGSAPVLSPDGRQIVYRAGHGLPLRVRPLDSLEFVEIRGSEGGILPFWSQNGAEIAFFSRGTLKKVALSAADPVVLADASDPQGGDWSPEGVILYSPDPRSPVLRVGGDRATSVAAAWPSFLPGGKSFLYTAAGGVFAGETRLLPDQSRAQYVDPGFVLYLRGGSLLAQPFDARRLRFTGEEVTVGTDVDSFSAAPSVLAYGSDSAFTLVLNWQALIMK